MIAEQARSSARQFLEALFTNKPEELNILIWTLADKNSRWFRAVDSAIRYAESANCHDVYIGVGLTGRDYGPDRRCPSNEIAAIAGLWVDIDLRSDAHPKATLPSTVEEALSILPADLPPSFIIFTGNGIHVWLLFRELYVFRNDDDRAAAASLSKRWNTLIRDNARARGWNIEAVVIHAHSNNRYDPCDLAKYLADLG